MGNPPGGRWATAAPGVGRTEGARLMRRDVAGEGVARWRNWGAVRGWGAVGVDLRIWVTDVKCWILFFPFWEMVR